MTDKVLRMRTAFHSAAFGARGWLPAWTLEEALRLTAEMGFDGLELAAVRPHAWPQDLSRERRRTIRRLVADWDLALSAVNPQTLYHNIASPVPEERTATVRNIVDCLDLATDLECGIVVVNGGWTVRPHSRDEAWCWAAEGLVAAAREAERRAVILVMENINSQRADVVVSSQDVEAMVAEVASPSLRPMIDFYHLHLESEDPLLAIKQFGTDLTHVHFLDARRQGRARIIPGLGELPLKEMLVALREVGYKGWLTVEIWGDDPITLGQQCAQALKALQQEAGVP